jgi:hypothetical protein
MDFLKDFFTIFEEFMEQIYPLLKYHKEIDDVNNAANNTASD